MHPREVAGSNIAHPLFGHRGLVPYQRRTYFRQRKHSTVFQALRLSSLRRRNAVNAARWLQERPRLNTKQH